MKHHHGRPPISFTEDDHISDIGHDPATDPLIERRPLLARGVSTMSVMGTVRLTDGDLIYVPSATADPRDPLNMKTWQKNAVVVLVCTFSAIGLSLIGGFGGVIAFYIPGYMANGYSYASISQLMTYPTLSMGLENLMGMPIAIAVGRRSVLLVAIIILIAGSLLCAVSTSLPMRLAARMIIGLAAGQSESVVPLVIQEIHFLHERTRVLMIQQTVQVIISGVWLLCASPIAKATSPSWWYTLGAIVASLVFLVSFFLVPETNYTRRSESVPEGSESQPQYCIQRPQLDFVKYRARTWRSDLCLWTDPPEWHKATEVLKQVVKFCWFPNVLWVVCLSGATLGVNISIVTTYNLILTAPPYNWQEESISYANLGQIAIALVCFPLLGLASDKLTQLRARRNDGMHEPESRLLLMAPPVAVGVVSAVFYGQAAAYPTHYDWFLIPATLAGYFFAFVGVNIICTTYLLDSYPTQAGPLLIVLGVTRGVLSCLVSFNVAHLIGLFGYDGTFNGFAVVTGALGILSIVMLRFGKNIRIFTSGWTRGGKR